MGNCYCCCVSDATREFDNTPLTDFETVALILGRDAPYKVRRLDNSRVSYAPNGTRIVSGAVVLYRDHYYNVYTTLYGTDSKYSRNGVPLRDFVYLTEQLRTTTLCERKGVEVYTHCVSPMQIRAVLIDNENVFIDSHVITEMEF